jgi:hypothetical protein
MPGSRRGQTALYFLETLSVEVAGRCKRGAPKRSGNVGKDGKQLVVIHCPLQRIAQMKSKAVLDCLYGMDVMVNRYQHS